MTEIIFQFSLKILMISGNFYLISIIIVINWYWDKKIILVCLGIKNIHRSWYMKKFQLIFIWNYDKFYILVMCIILIVLEK